MVLKDERFKMLLYLISLLIFSSGLSSADETTPTTAATTSSTPPTSPTTTTAAPIVTLAVGATAPSLSSAKPSSAEITTAANAESAEDSPTTGPTFSLNGDAHPHSTAEPPSFPTGPSIMRLGKCTSMNQSPVNLKRNARKVVFEPISLQYWDRKLFDPVIHNDGRTVYLNATTSSGESPRLSGGPLPKGKTYRFAKLRFRWGNDDLKGSDHAINSQKYPLEAQFINYDHKYKEKEALYMNDGVAVFSFLFVTGERNPAWDRITSRLGDIQNYKETADVRLERLADLFPKDSKWKWDYFTYRGTLGAPHCNETVVWIVFRTFITISEAQLHQFRTLMDKRDDPMVNNFNPVQQLNCRKVFIGTGYWDNPNVIKNLNTGKHSRPKVKVHPR